MKRMKAAELVLDFDLYPRNGLDGTNVQNIAEAILAGQEMPPVLADRKSKRVADGFHRVRAAMRARGEDAEVDVIFKDYKSDAALFLDAMRLNASHGARLDPFDRAHCAIVAERLRIPEDAVAGALNMTVDRLATLKANRTARTAGGLSIPLKAGVAKKFAGRKLTKGQEAANEKLSGMSPLFHVNQLILLIENDMLADDDDNLEAGLRKLHGLIEGRIAAAV